MLGGSLLVHKAQHSQECESGLFDITIVVELQQMHAKDLSTTVERLTGVIGPKLAQDRASFHINVKPAVDKLDLQPSLLLPGTDCRIEYCYYLYSTVKEFYEKGCQEKSSASTGVGICFSRSRPTLP